MKIASSGIPHNLVEELTAELRPEIEAEIDTDTFAYRSTDAPSWISFLATADWWVQALATYAALYVAEIVKEAGKDTWKNRAKAVTAVRSVGNAIRKLASSIAHVRSKLEPGSSVTVGIPVPDWVYTTDLKLSTEDEDELAVELALFVHHLPKLGALIESEGLHQGAAVGWINLRILPDGSLEVQWMDKQSLDDCRRVLPLDRGAL